MNYLFQLRGLINDQGERVARLLESATAGAQRVHPATGMGSADRRTSGCAARYRTGWYAPKATSYLKNRREPPQRRTVTARRSCEGRRGRLVEPPMVRRGRVANEPGAIDWNANGPRSTRSPPRTSTSTASSTPTRTPIRSRRCSTPGRTTGTTSPESARRPAQRPAASTSTRATGKPSARCRSTSVAATSGVATSAVAISAAATSAVATSGVGDIGRGDIGRGDIGRCDIGRGDIGRGDFGGGDLDVGGANEPFSELDLETAQAVGNSPPPSGIDRCAR